MNERRHWQDVSVDVAALDALDAAATDLIAAMKDGRDTLSERGKQAAARLIAAAIQAQNMCKTQRPILQRLMAFDVRFERAWRKTLQHGRTN